MVVPCPNVGGAFLLFLCGCAQEEQPGFTGEWLRTQPDIVYYFGDDSRFWQSDRPGEQWIWKQENDRVRLLGAARKALDSFLSGAGQYARDRVGHVQFDAKIKSPAILRKPGGRRFPFQIGDDW
ncbi:MAG: hypothetical protein IPK73_30775 [Candidatus Obscuribacter sp.]|nr:hypothetical protein [Candidatus Obscuribacter sp.]